MKTAKSLERLDKVLSNWGYGTRKEVKRLIHSGDVTVNGQIQQKEDFHVDLNQDSICVAGEEMDIPHDVCFMMNKPAGYVCSMVSDSHPVLFELLSEDDKNKKFPSGNLSMVGRLDLDTEGLLLITSDGNLNHRLTSPKWNVEKEYLVKLRDKVSSDMQQQYIQMCSQEITLPAEGRHEEEVAKPCKLNWRDEESCTIIVTEGKFHEVKRIFMALGNEVVYLKRIRINTLVLDETLESGKYRNLTQEEIESLEDL